MSQMILDSPASDTKMDISETTTTSQDSPVVSPTTESLETENISKLITTTTTTTTKSTKESFLDNHLNLENDNSDGNTSNTSSYRTLVDQHPLMSPAASENGHRQYFSYPDVVPESEQPLRLGNPNANAGMTGDSLNVIEPVSGRRKISVLRSASPDFLSSESEAEDLSQYQANVEPSFQTVSLVPNSSYKATNTSPKIERRRKIALADDLLNSDVSSIDTMSNHSFDDDLNLVSLSPSSSFVLDEKIGRARNTIKYNKEDDESGSTPTTPKNVEPLPQYTEAEERRDSRNWQKITLPDGKTREIDMKVIDPYKRVLSHGGYLQSGGHNAIIVFCACHLPDRSRTDYHYVMDNLFLYVVKTVEQLVTEDYVLVYLHGGSHRGNVPPFPWLKKCYQLIDRRLRKSLKNLYLVHPTFWLKSIVWMSRPFISAKFWRKLVYIRSLEELFQIVPAVEKAAVPDKVKNYDSKNT